MASQYFIRRMIRWARISFLAFIQQIPPRAVDQRWLILPRYTQPSSDTKLLIEKLRLELPNQPPPRLTAPTESNEINEIEAQTVR